MRRQEAAAELDEVEQGAWIGARLVWPFLMFYFGQLRPD